ncbi:MAG: M48 family metallopeptidase [Kiritimatiellia bacterium]
MDFFAHQEQARKRSGMLVVLYGLAVLAITLSVYALLMTLLHVADDEPDGTLAWWNATVALWTFLLVPFVVFSGSFFKVMELRQGGGTKVARMLGGAPVRPDTRDAAERKLLNVVEEMAIAAGVPVPAVFVMQTEKGINAFAAGYSQRDAVIGVTRGCIDTLSRDELQGVIAHEFSHIVNGDMRLNIRLMGILFGIIMITFIGRILLRTAYLSGSSGRSRGSNNKKGGNPLPFIGIALIIIGYVGVFFANLIKSAISRQREFLADAAAVQYTRNPGGIASALRRIAKLSMGARLTNAHAAEAGHLFFGDCSRHFMSLFATHPPLEERIRRIDASGTWQQTAHNTPPPLAPTVSQPAEITEDTELAGVINLVAAREIMRMMPTELETATHDPLKARATLYAMLWFAEEKFQQRQRESLTRLDPTALPLIETFLPSVKSMNQALRLPLAERLLPALRTMPENIYPDFSKALLELTEANEEVDLFEFAVRNMILRQLGSVFGSVDKATIRHRSLDTVRQQIEILLSALARWGTPSTTSAEPCYQAGMHNLQWKNGTLRDVSLDDVARALAELAHAAPFVKRRCIQACTTTILHDGNIAPAQYDLLRAIADGLDIPMPPMQPTMEQAA